MPWSATVGDWPDGQLVVTPAYGTAAQQQVRGTLKLNAPDAVMVDILPPLMDRFLQLHPNMRVEIVVEDRLVGITAAGGGGANGIGNR